jgi:hypothetical protein
MRREKNRSVTRPVIISVAVGQDLVGRTVKQSTAISAQTRSALHAFRTQTAKMRIVVCFPSMCQKEKKEFVNVFLDISEQILTSTAKSAPWNARSATVQTAVQDAIVDTINMSLPQCRVTSPTRKSA